MARKLLMGISVIEKTAIGLSLLATLAAMSMFVYTEFIFEKPPISPSEGLSELKTEVSRLSIPTSFDIENIVINLHSNKGRRLRFLNLSLHIIPFSPEQIEVVERFEPLIFDSIIDVSGHMEPAELNSVAGKILFETRLKKSINERTKIDLIKEILFSKFVVQ